MTSLSGLDYRTCTPSQLEHFIKARTGYWPDLVPRPLAHHLQQLGTLDNNWMFRFMDLPSELREIVYKDLLTPKSGRQTTRIPAGAGRFLEILRLNKEVSKEASAILYRDHEVPMRFTIRRSEDAYWTATYLDLGNSYHTVIPDNCPDQRPDSILDRLCLDSRLANPLLRAKKLRISIETKCRYLYAEDSWKVLHRWLYALASLLGESKNLRELNLDYIDDRNCRAHTEHTRLPDDLGALLYPITRFAGLAQVRFHGLVKDLRVFKTKADGSEVEEVQLLSSTEQLLQRQMQSAHTLQPFTPIQSILSLRNKGEEVTQLLHDADDTSPLLNSLAFAVEGLEKFLPPGVLIDAKLDRKISAVVSSLLIMFEENKSEIRRLRISAAVEKVEKEGFNLEKRVEQLASESTDGEEGESGEAENGGEDDEVENLDGESANSGVSNSNSESDDDDTIVVNLSSRR